MPSSTIGAQGDNAPSHGGQQSFTDAGGNSQLVTASDALPASAGPIWNYGRKVIGAYRMTNAGPAYTGMAKDTPVCAIRYTGTNRLVLTAIAARIYITGVFSTNQLVGHYCRKAEDFTVGDSGSDLATDLMVRVDSDMPELTTYTAQQAAAGGTGLTAGTRTLKGIFFRDAIFSTTGQTAESSYLGAPLPYDEQHPICLHQNEGFIMFNTYAVDAGSVRFGLAAAFTEVSD